MPAALASSGGGVAVSAFLDRAFVERLSDAELVELLLQRFRNFIGAGFDPYQALQLAVGLDI